jgi:ParB-like chromosome segregation protein Spo0J
MMNGEEFDNLVADIKERGLLEPVWLTPGGVLLDGRNRARACEAAGVNITTRIYTGGDPVGFVVSMNLTRRHLTTGQRAMLALEVEQLIAATNRAGRPVAVPFVIDGQESFDALDDDDEEIESVIRAELHELNTQERRSDSKAAKVTGTSGRAVSQAKRVAAASPELAEKVKAGTLALNKAEAQARAIEASNRAESQQSTELADIIARLKNGETIIVNMSDDIARALDAQGLLTRIDRGTPWGNPFLLDDDGDRDTVIASYRDHYLPHKPSLINKLPTLKGRALGCWCAPLPCHGDALKGAM